MVIHGADGMILKMEQSREQELRGKIAMDTLLLEIEEEQGYRRVHERIEELKLNLIKAKSELQQIEDEKMNGMKYRRTKPTRWNWR